VTARRGALLGNLAAGAILLALVVGWASAGPRQFGGPATYTIALGKSMEPTFHQGDLIILRTADQYFAGDVIAYRSATLNTTVLHRIISVDAAGFTTRGDHNTFYDPDHPRPADVIGSVWLRLPGAGSWLDAARQPANAATLFALAGLFGMGVPAAIARRLQRTPKPKSGRRRPASTPGTLAGAVTGLAVVVGILALATAGTGYLAYYVAKQPLTKTTTRPYSYKLLGTYNYSSTVPSSVVYPEGKVNTGDPVFLKITKGVDTSFDFQFTADGFPALVQGSARLDGVLRSDGSGWKRTFPLQGDTPISNGKVSLAGHLDLGDLVQTEKDYLAATGLQRESFTLELQPKIHLTARVPNAVQGPVVESFAPVLDFRLDDSTFEETATSRSGAEGGFGAGGAAAAAAAGGGAAAASASSDPYHPNHSGTVTRYITLKNALGVFGFSSTVAKLKPVTLWVYIASMVLLVLAIALLTLALLGRDEPTRIERRYGSMLVPVGTIGGIRGEDAVEVTSMSSLVRLAQHHDLMILHEVDQGRHYYAIQDGNLFYFYPSQERALTPAPPAAAGVE